MYDSSNRLTSAGGCTYTYNAEDVRIKKVMGESETTYVYDTREKLSKLLVKCTDGVYTKYVYGLGLIGEESITGFKTYHYDYRGSTVAITDAASTVTDTFTYDTYGKLTARTGTTVTPFMYNGRDGVMTDENGLYYMRARYYHPEIKRFINADIVAGKISNAITLNRFAYADGNPVSNIDPFGLSAERGYTVDYRNDINGIGLLDDGTILAGNNVTSDDILTLIVISEMTKSGCSKQEILEFVNTYVDGKKNDTVIKKDKLLEYYTAFEDATKPLTKLMIRAEYEYTMVNNKLSYADIPLYWTTKLMEFKANVENKGIWDLKQLPEWQQSSLYYFNGELVDNDAPGNIMYGYIGKAYGIPNDVLYLGAGIAQIAACTSKAQWIYSGTGDDPIDYKNIVRGIEYYDEFH